MHFAPPWICNCAISVITQDQYICLSTALIQATGQNAHAADRLSGPGGDRHVDPCSADSTTTAVSLARAVRSHTRSLIRSTSATILAPRKSLSLPATLLRPLSLTSTASSGAGDQNYCFVAVNTTAILFTAAINAASHACLMPKISAITFIYMGAKGT